MFKLFAKKNVLEILQKEMVTSGSVNVYPVQFVFDNEWNGLQRTAVFWAGNYRVSVLLDSTGMCTIPWEVMQTKGRYLYAGVYGTKDGEIVLPTMSANLGQIYRGTEPGESAQPPTPSVYEQLLADIGNLDELDTQTKASLVAAINEVYATGGGGGGAPGKDGGYYTPSVDASGALTWTPSESDMPQVPSSNIQGPPGKDGTPGENGATFTPSVSTDGDLSWTNDGGLQNPDPVNIKGEPGEGIPEITDQDNGKVLGALGGVAVWVDGVGAPSEITTDDVTMAEDITLAGNYTQVGNWTKAQNGTAEKAVKGMTLTAVLKDMLTATLQPTITAQPSISGLALTGAGAVEAGTRLPSVSYTAASLSPGSYQYGPETGVSVTSWTLTRVTNLGNTQVVSVQTQQLPAGSDNNDGNGFVIGDVGGDGAVSSLRYQVTADHTAGVTAHDNLGGDSNPPVAIQAGTKSKQTSAYSPYRNYFYGATQNKPTLDSAYIRGLTKSNRAYQAGAITINVPAGVQRVAIACVATAAGVTRVINETALNADVTSTFIKSTIQVDGAGGYTAIDYNVWVFEPAVPYESAAVLKVTLG